MKLTDNRKSKRKMKFADLPLGACFEDAMGYICIKTGMNGTCIFYCTENEWDYGTMGLGAEVTPLNSNLTIS